MADGGSDAAVWLARSAPPLAEELVVLPLSPRCSAALVWLARPTPAVAGADDGLRYAAAFRTMKTFSAANSWS